MTSARLRSRLAGGSPADRHEFCWLGAPQLRAGSGHQQQDCRAPTRTTHLHHHGATLQYRVIDAADGSLGEQGAAPVRWRAGEPLHCAALAATTRFSTGDCASSAARSSPPASWPRPPLAGSGAVGMLSSLPPPPPLGTVEGAKAPKACKATAAPPPVVRGLCCCRGGEGGGGRAAALQGCSGSGAGKPAAARRFSRGASLRPCASSALRQQKRLSNPEHSSGCHSGVVVEGGLGSTTMVGLRRTVARELS